MAGVVVTVPIIDDGLSDACDIVQQQHAQIAGRTGAFFGGAAVGPSVFGVPKLLHTAGCEHEFMQPVQLLQCVMGFRRGGFRTGGIVGIRMHDIGVQGIAQSSCALELQPAVVDGASSGVAQNTERLDRAQGGGAMPPCFRVQILVGAVVLVAKFMLFDQTRHCAPVGFQIMAIA